MNKQPKDFIEVFAKFDFPAKLTSALKTAMVESIDFDNEKNIITIKLQLFEIIDEKYIKLLKSEILKNYSFSCCNIFYTYDLKEHDAKKNISIYWDNLMESVFDESPVAKSILLDSNWHFADNILNINITSSGAFILKSKKIDVLIRDILNQRLNINVATVFKDSKPDENDKKEYLENLVKREAELIDNLTVTASSDSSTFSPSASFQNNKPNNPYPKRRGGRREVSVNPDLKGVVTNLRENLDMDDEILIEGMILSFDLRKTKSGKFLIIFDLSDGTDSITVKFFIQPEKYDDDFKALLKKGSSIKVFGRVQFDEYSNEVNIMANEIAPSTYALTKREDKSQKKRVELHLHTNMSQMDATNTASDYIKLAKEWGHTAIAITDHGVVQAFPEAMEASKKHGVKIIYGLEAYLIDDLGAIIKGAKDKTIDDDFVVFDLETTGLKKETCEIIEIGAVKLRNGKIIDKFSALINPHVLLPAKIIELTKITDDMLIDKPSITEVMLEFFEFIGDSTLVAHNASFDTGFIRQNAMKMGLELDNPVLCTVELTRVLFPELKNHKLATLTKHFEISLENHHRACDDAEATSEILLKCLDVLREKNVYDLKDINLLTTESMNKKTLRPHHAIILAKNSVGLRNLYELVSNSHIYHFSKRPRIPKSEYLKYKEGLIIGTACEAGEFYKAVKDNMPKDYISELADFYDYFEIQPVANNGYLVREGYVSDTDGLRNINKRIVELGEEYNKPVIATCDVHFMNPEDEIYRKILMAGSGFKDVDESTPLFFKTTEEMLAEFSYLGPEKCEEVVITNTNLIADMIETIKPIPDETFPPKIDGAEDELKEITMEQAHLIYGDVLPEIVEKRLDRELTSIIKNGFSVMYIIAQKLVWKSVEDGYLVGSRGSVGSSFVATMSGITEVNPLPPHYICPNCKYSDFASEEVLEFVGASGCDMPDKNCPVCNHLLSKDGHDIPFETFLGFDGDKEPDIDLNFSGEYQAKAHAYTEELFGSDFVFKAGTIGTLADKTAFGYVKKYLDERQITSRNAEINRLVQGCTGIKRTTGQHPGGLMVVPSDQSIYNFCPIQRPANDMKSDVTTTHFDYHSISGRLLKLDILGHDVPTIIRMLHDFTGVDPRNVDLGDKQIMSLFTSPDALGVSEEMINCKTGSLGLPEFGTPFVRQMLIDTQPNSFAELVRISGLSHGTDVWFNNAQQLIKDEVATLKDVIPTRDDIMVYLINKGVEKMASFKIMENVRKGKGLKDDEVEIMKNADVPDWYIESCKKIKYMFPKGHAVAYVMMTVRIGYFKIHHPLAFYAASFSVKADSFDYEFMCKGKDIVRAEMRRITSLGKEATTKEKDSLTMLELVLEMYERGLKFTPLDLYESEATKFKIVDNTILPPLCSIPGLGVNAALNLIEARKNEEFISIQDFRERTRISKTVIEILKNNNILKGIPETNQLSLF